MFDKINLISIESDHRLTTRLATEEKIRNYKADATALKDTSFCIWGSVDSFIRPPITEFAKSNLYYLQDFNVFHYNYGSYTKRQNYHSYQIVYTYGGCGTLEYCGKIYTLNEGEGYFIDCMEHHLYQVTDKHWDVGVLHLQGELLPALYQQYSLYGTPLFFDPVDGQFQQFLEEILETYATPQASREWIASHKISQLLTYLLQLGSKDEARRLNIPDNMRYIIKYIESNYSKPLSLDYLADFASISKYHFSREFKKYTGFTPTDYIISLRINRAKGLLKGTSLPASAIAHEVGIHDMNNFTNLFRKKTGMTPTQYRMK